ncbi:MULTISPECIES: avidin/streptavidin family protein [Marinomonas]|nr:avidin/streptavidin family protein [Marinomonas sp. KJ51-3]MCW4629868.1 avidin/streptavidin family protein [Marinomonas sp. KJ51-3]
MALVLNGTWENSYGSTMVLDVDEEGFIFGEYRSHTGSTGTYLVIGHCSPSDPTSDVGQPLVLSIYWRSIGGEEPDDGSHWVSTYCGQLDNNGHMTVINSLVTTTSFQAFSPGDYIDKLIFTKQSSLNRPSAKNIALLAQPKVPIANPINGVWSDKEQGIELFLFLQDQEYGVVNGWLSYNNEIMSMLGFTDILVDNNILQSISVSGYMLNTNQPISLIGRISQNGKALVLSRWLSNSTTAEEAYFQASSMNWELTKN